MYKTATKNRAKTTIVCVDLSATWTGSESGGQSVLERWAGDFPFQNGLRKLADKKHQFIYTRGGDGQLRTSMNHVIHKGESTSIKFDARFVSHALMW